MHCYIQNGFVDCPRNWPSNYYLRLMRRALLPVCPGLRAAMGTLARCTKKKLNNNKKKHTIEFKNLAKYTIGITFFLRKFNKIIKGTHIICKTKL